MDAIMQSFKNDFDCFWGLMLKQIEVCPDELWNRRVGGWIFWQQVMHSIACVELFVLPEGQAGENRFSRDDMLLLRDSDERPSKAELLEMAGKMKELADSYIDNTTSAQLGDIEPGMTRRLGRESTRQNAIMALIRHCCYHLGCCDAILRENGIPGVY